MLPWLALVLSAHNNLDTTMCHVIIRTLNLYTHTPVVLDVYALHATSGTFKFHMIILWLRSLKVTNVQKLI